MNRETDEESLRLFLRKIADDRLLDTLIPRLREEDVQDIVAFFSGILHRYLREKEYHTLFL
ncbi:MAG: cytoplasmic protein [Thermodesulfobacteriota bacterium]